MTGARLSHGGRIERDAPISFRWNGRALQGFRGDTVASALLANGVGVVARGFKYHRPRGITAAGQEEGAALVTIGEGARTTPNLKPGTVELAEGMSVRAQNCWPSVEHDVGEINDLLSPFLAAGFYYKTFMGVLGGTREWMFAERFIRSAAGLGRASYRADPDWYEHVHGHCDVLVVGSGPAGLAAALECAENGLDVVLAEQDFELGGDLLTDGKVGEHAAEYHRVEMLGALRASGCARLMPRTQVFGLYDHGVAGLAERVPGGGERPRERLHVMRARRIIVAAGALERPFVFGGNDRPGVMLADAARAFLRRWGVAPGRRAVIAGNNDGAYRAAAALADGGVATTLVDSRASVSGDRLDTAEAAGVRVRLGVVPVRTLGRRAVRGLVIGRHKGGGRAEGEETLTCDLVAVSGGWSPALHLTSHVRARPVWHARDACFLPGEGDGTVLTCGAATGVWRREDAVVSGRAAGRAAALSLGSGGGRRKLAAPAPGGWETPLDPLWEIRPESKPKKGFVDLANDVTAEDLRLAQAEGYESVEHAKRYTTLGMAPDQGKTSNVVGLALLAQARDASPEDVGTTTFRPPYAPVSMGVFAGIEGGPMWEPVRRTPFHAAAEASGAVFVDAGIWKRAWFYPRRGESLAAASMREAAMVRATVGVADVSTLGKLRVQGPDAAAFLDRIYSNLMSTLPIGKARYGFMLREDGVAYDDGTVWRLADDDFLVTATTAHAHGVHDHLEIWAARWPELRVDVTDETEGWAGLAVAGPRARAALARCTSADVADAALPFMGLAEAEVCGLSARIARISFSGELAYEVYARPEGAEALWDGLVAAAKAEGGGLYGLEALDILRVEKGHATHREMDGRVTVADLGMPRMLSRKKAFLGGALARRPGLTDPDRPSLVGLEPEEAGAAPLAGAVLTTESHRKGHGLGHIASIADSPARGGRIALGFIAGGLDRWEGKTVVAKDPTAGAQTRMRVVAPTFVDPDGERLRG